VLVEEADGDLIGRAAHQGPEVDGNVRLITADRRSRSDLVDAVVAGNDGADLVATVICEQRASLISAQELISP
jgi:ribosomal protein S12 methylthiotransferase